MCRDFARAPWPLGSADAPPDDYGLQLGETVDRQHLKGYTVDGKFYLDRADARELGEWLLAWAVSDDFSPAGSAGDAGRGAKSVRSRTPEV